ncbi:MAG: VanZ family protein [Chloroflexi bacterium]|nr:VanZ family protein [Chloroflexota bacterium]
MRRSPVLALTVGLSRPARWLRWLAPAAWMGLMSFVSQQSSPPEPRLPSGLLAFLGGHEDKLFHFVEFAILAMLLRLALGTARPKLRALLMVVVGCALFAATDEVHQAFVPGRDASPLDGLTDVAGAVSGLLLTHWVLGWARYRLGRLSQSGRIL